MPISIIICDDSSMARKQMARILPSDWDVEITYAENGQQALDAIHKNLGTILFLDLNMPVLDGYQVLEAVQKENITITTIVVSGDIQEEARKRVESLGAVAFIKKPTQAEDLNQLLIKLNVYQPTQETSQTDETPQEKKTAIKQPATTTNQSSPLLKVNLRSAVQEIANVAMGQSASMLAELLNVFVKMPIPNVNLLEIQELSMLLKDIDHKENTFSLCQSFISAGISGEALLIFHNTDFDELAKMMKYPQATNKEIEILMDTSNILIGAFLQGVGKQLDMSFVQHHPILLGDELSPADLLKRSVVCWKKILTIEINFGIEDKKINCDLLFLFTESSLHILENKLNYLLDDDHE